MKEISRDQLVERLEAGEQIAILDIRESDEYEDWHIYSATNVPVYNAIKMGDESVVNGRLKSVTAGKPVVAVCRMGNTSKVAAEILESMGHDAFSLVGGIHGWSGAWSEAEIPFKSVEGFKLFQIRRNGKGCLSYMFGSKEQAAIVDACVDIDVYKSLAERHGMKITHVLETHVHADHISRAPELAAETGAGLFLPENDRVVFEYKHLTDGQTLDIGGISVTVISTPGHTGESVCFDLGGEVLISGDTIFTESVGRPDLEQGDAGAEKGAGMLFDSLHDKILSRYDHVTVCPGHVSYPIGFDSVPISADLADVKKAVDLLTVDKPEFVSTILASLGQKPPNFNRVISVNEGKVELGFLDPLELEAGPNRCAAK